MFCPFCGFGYDDNFKFCPKCGKQKPQKIYSDDTNLKSHSSEIKNLHNKLSDDDIDISARIKAYFVDEFINIVIILIGFICFGIFIDNNISYYGVNRCLDPLIGSLIFLPIILTVNFLYISIFEIMYKATLGKMIFNLKVVDLSNEPISLFQCFVRFITKPFAGLLYPIYLVFCLLGFRISEYGRRYGYSYNERDIFNQNFWIFIILIFLNFLYLIINYIYLTSNKRSISDKFFEINVVKV